MTERGAAADAGGRSEGEQAAPLDATERVDLLLRDLRSSRGGLSTREAQRRLLQYGGNELRRRGGLRWPRELARQFTHPLALLLWTAAGLAWIAGISPIAIAVVIVIVLNAILAFVQEAQAERAVEALASYLPETATTLRDGTLVAIPARELVPGDILRIAEGNRISADARLLEGSIEMDLSMLTGESAATNRSADAPSEPHLPLAEAPGIVLSGTTCTEGEASAVVFATGMHTELGRIAALSERVRAEESPLEAQVRRVAWLIAAIAVGLGIAFMPIAMLGAGLPLTDALIFAIGLLVSNVPEGLLPVITLALAVGVRALVRDGAVVKRLSAVETLGSTDVICTDKTGTLTENRMRPRLIWSLRGSWAIGDVSALDAEPSAADAPEERLVPLPTLSARPEVLDALGAALAACSNARLSVDGAASGDPTEVALLEAATALGFDVDAESRLRKRRAEFHFDASLKLMSTVEEREGGLWVDAKGAPEALLPRCSETLREDGQKAWDATAAISDSERERVLAAVERCARSGLRVLALASRRLRDDAAPPQRREQAERDLVFLGLVAAADPPRPEVAGAVRECHSAGIRVIVITGDHGLTATAIARQVGIVTERSPQIVTGAELEAMSEHRLDELLGGERELIFARSSPEAKLRIADALRAEQHVVAMTGDGVNDAPALRRADIGVAMGRSGTDVAREASTMVLTDDNFATIAAAVRSGRQVYDNIRKFILYIFAHATPEVLPFLVFALSGGAIPLALPVLQLLAIDVGTETLPALALGREPAEPGLMRRPPRPRSEGVIQGSMLLRAWVYLGLASFVLVMGNFLYVLTQAGWSPGDPTGAGHPLHHAYLQATTAAFVSMVACQVGTAFAARTERASLRAVGILSNRLLLWGIGFELALTAAIVYLPALQALLATAPPPGDALLLALPFPLIVWGSDELRRMAVRRADEPVTVAARS